MGMPYYGGPGPAQQPGYGAPPQQQMYGGPGGHPYPMYQAPPGYEQPWMGGMPPPGGQGAPPFQQPPAYGPQGGAQ